MVQGVVVKAALWIVMSNCFSAPDYFPTGVGVEILAGKHKVHVKSNYCFGEILMWMGKEFFSQLRQNVDLGVAEDGIFFGIEVVKEGSFGDFCSGTDVLDGDVVESVAKHECGGCIFYADAGFESLSGS